MAGGLVALVAPKSDGLISPLSAESCVERLRAAIDSDFTLFGSKPFVGSVGGTSGRLRKRIGYRNSFQTVTRLTFKSQPRGTAITCRSGMSVFVYVFMTFWFGFLGLVGLATGGDNPGFVVFPLGMMAFGVGLILFGRFLARNEHGDIVAFVARITEGKVASAPTPGMRSIVE